MKKLISVGSKNSSQESGNDSGSSTSSNTKILGWISFGYEVNLATTKRIDGYLKQYASATQSPTLVELVPNIRRLFQEKPNTIENAQHTYEVLMLLTNSNSDTQSLKSLCSVQEISDLACEGLFKTFCIRSFHTQFPVPDTNLWEDETNKAWIYCASQCRSPWHLCLNIAEMLQPFKATERLNTLQGIAGSFGIELTLEGTPLNKLILSLATTIWREAYPDEKTIPFDKNDTLVNEKEFPLYRHCFGPLGPFFDIRDAKELYGNGISDSGNG